MRRLLNAVWLKLIAVLVASLSFLFAIVLSIAVISHFEWFVDENKDWYASESMQSWNSSYSYEIQVAFEAARHLEAATGSSVPNLNTANYNAPLYTHWVSEDSDLTVEEQIEILSSDYQQAIENLNRMFEQYIVTDGERVLFSSSQVDQLALESIGVSPDTILEQLSMLRVGTADPVYMDYSAQAYQVDDQIYSSRYNYYFTPYSEYDVAYLLKTTVSNIDGYRGQSYAFSLIVDQRTAILVSLTVSIILFILLLVYIFNAAGYRRSPDGQLAKRGEISLSWLDRIPLELLTAAVGVAVVFCTIFFFELLDINSANTYYYSERIYEAFNAQTTNSLALIGRLITPSIIFAASGAYLGVLLVATYILSLVRRLKARSFWRYSLVGAIGRRVKSLWLQLNDRLEGRRKLILGLVLYFVSVILFLIILANAYYGFTLFVAVLVGGLLFILLPLAIFAHLTYLDYSTRMVSAYSLDLAKGKEPLPIDSAKLHPQFRPLYGSLQQLDEGLQEAVSRQLQADRLKTDLITNVSHDLKTPLTSIINYIDLLKREGLDSADAQSYLDTLDQKAQRLKVLTEDLVEASKASSGNLPVEREWLDLVELLRQVSGEFEDKMMERSLALILRMPEALNHYSIYSDGHHIWRILENLMENARKYALEGSRVYLTLAVQEKQFSIQVKNISAIPLDLSTQELMERFVRGDSSRQTEGSGLGLSITQSLADLLGGRMELDVRDDVFVATVILPVDTQVQPERVIEEEAPLGPLVTTESIESV